LGSCNRFVTRMRALVPITVIVVTLLGGCGRTPERVIPPQQDWFVDRAKETGLDFVHVNGMSGKLYMSEILAPGVALCDYDGDGDLDVYLVQGSGLGTRGSGPGTRDPGLVPRSRGGLFRNDLAVNRDGIRAVALTC